MKAKPVRIVDGKHVECTPSDATHLNLHFPGPLRFRSIAVITHGTREGSPCWTWNGSTDSPTLRPSVLSRVTLGDREVICHSWVTDGRVQFLGDCNHSLAGQTIDLLDVKTTSMWSDDE
jgi:hypothetical protein